MKANIEKLAAFLVIATIVASISTTIATGDDWKAIRGEYAGTSVVTCNTYRPIGIFTGTQTQLSIYTFNGDGTGTVQARSVAIDFLPAPSEGFSDMSWNFTYEVADDGTITMDAVIGEAFIIDPSTGVALFKYVGGTWSDTGRFSVDHKTIVLGTAQPNETQFLNLANGKTFVTKCNSSRVLSRVGN